jgi:quinol monooxygenase YgiN
VPAMFLVGTSYTAVANSLGVSAQLALPDWVRARGMSMYQMAIMGASALGAALWGQVATLGSLRASLSIAAISGAMTMLAAYLLTADPGGEEDITPARDYEAPVIDAPRDVGRVLVTVEYRIDPARVDEFRALMHETRRSRLRRGALSWRLLRNLADAGRFMEHIVDESWSEHLRRADRMTAADAALRRRRLAFHIGESPPLVTCCVIDAGARR